jgi:hypothetical protein
MSEKILTDEEHGGMLFFLDEEVEKSSVLTTWTAEGVSID